MATTPKKKEPKNRTTNPGYGYHGRMVARHGKGKADEMFDKAHALVKRITGDSNVERVKHYLDSTHGRHLDGNERDPKYIKRDYQAFMKKYDPHLFESQKTSDDFADTHNHLTDSIAKRFAQDDYHVSSSYKETPHQIGKPGAHRTATTHMTFTKPKVGSDGHVTHEHVGTACIITSNRDPHYHGISLSNDKTNYHPHFGSEHKDGLADSIHKVFHHASGENLKESVDDIIRRAMKKLAGQNVDEPESDDARSTEDYFNSHLNRVVSELAATIRGNTADVLEESEGSVPKRHLATLQKRRKTIQKKREQQGNSDQVAKKGS